MKKIIVATHHKLADGFKDTLDYIAPNTVNIITLCAYMDNTSVNNQIEDILKGFENKEKVIVLTDLLGGSVNQEFVKKLSNYNIDLITGVNLPLLLTLALNINNETFDDNFIRQAVEESRKQLVYVNDYLKEQELDENDE